MRFKPPLKWAGCRRSASTTYAHTCATLLLTRNVNPKIVSEMLGHSTIAITLDTYSHVLPNMRDQTAAAMEEALSGPTAAALLPQPPESIPGAFLRLHKKCTVCR